MWRTDKARTKVSRSAEAVSQAKVDVVEYHSKYAPHSMFASIAVGLHAVLDPLLRPERTTQFQLNGNPTRNRLIAFHGRLMLFVFRIQSP